MDNPQMDILLEDLDEEKYRIRYQPLVKRPKFFIRDIPIYATSYDNERKKQARRRRFKFGNPRDKKKWVTDEHADIEEEDEDDEEENLKTHWNTTYQAKMASIALIFSTSNLIRFPFACYLNGGIVFFLIYSIMVIFLVQPLIFFELLIGQFSTNGLKGFSKLDKYANGLPYAAVFICLIFSTFNNAVVGYNGIYAWSSFYTDPGKCDSLWNTLTSCVAYGSLEQTQFNESIQHTEKDITTSRLSTELFFREYVLDLDWTGVNLKGNFTWKFLAGLVIVFILAAFVVKGRLTTIISKVLISCSLIVPGLVFGLYIRQLFREGAHSGENYFCEFRWGKLRSIDFWSEAIRLAFTTAGVGFGLYTHIASRHNFYFDQLHSTSWLVCGGLLTFSSVSSLVVFMELGVLEDKLELKNNHYSQILSERSGISFITMSGILSDLSFRPITFIFFISLNIFGIWTQIVSTEMCTSFAVRILHKRFSSNKRLTRYASLVGVIFLQLGFTSIFGTKAGHIILDSGHLFGGTWAAVVILLTELFTAFVLYGYHVFLADIEIMMDYHLPSLFKLQMKYYVGPALIMTLILMTIHWFRTPATYHNLNNAEEYEKSVWIYIFGICLNFIPLIVMIVFALHTVRMTFKVGHLDDAVEEDLLPHLLRRSAPLKRDRRDARPDFFRDIALSLRPSMVMSKAREQEWEAHKWLKFHQHFKSQLEMLHKYLRAKCHWQKATNLVILSNLKKAENCTNAALQTISWVVREKERERNFIETEYLNELVEKCSIENMIGHFDIIEEDHQEDRLLDRLLRSVALPKVKFSTLFPEENEYGDTYNKLIGRLQPSNEERYEALVTRVKDQLGIQDTSKLRAIRNNRFRLEYEIVSSTEDAPLEFPVPLRVTLSPSSIVVNHILNVIVIKGREHSLLKKLSVPRPLVLKIPYSELSEKTMNQIHQYLISLASRYMASTVLKEVKPLPQNPKLHNNVHKLVYDFLDPRCTCVIVLEEEPFNWEKRDDWFFKKTNDRGIKHVLIPQDIEVTLAKMIRLNTKNALGLGLNLSNSQYSIISSSSSESETVENSWNNSIACSKQPSVCQYEETFGGELPRLIFWNEKVPPGDIDALREARKVAKRVEQETTEGGEGGKNEDVFKSVMTLNPRVSTGSLDIFEKYKIKPLGGSNETLYGSNLSVSSESEDLVSVKPVWSKGTVIHTTISRQHSPVNSSVKEDEFGVHHFESHFAYRKRRQDHVTHLEKRLNNNRRDFIYYSAGKCLIVQMRNDNAFIYAESGDSIASNPEKNEPTTNEDETGETIKDSNSKTERLNKIEYSGEKVYIITNKKPTDENSTSLSAQTNSANESAKSGGNDTLTFNDTPLATTKVISWKASHQNDSNKLIRKDSPPSKGKKSRFVNRGKTVTFSGTTSSTKKKEK